MKETLLLAAILVVQTTSIAACTTSSGPARLDGSAPDGSAPDGSTPRHSSEGAHDAGDAGGSTFTFETDGTRLAAGAESFVCKDFANPFGADVAVVSADSEIDAAAHHLYVFVLPDLTDTSTTSCDVGGLEFHDYIHATQASRDRVVYPDGVGRIVGANLGFRLNLHLLNTSPTPVVAAARFTVRYTRPDEVRHPAHSIFLNDTALMVPLGESTVQRSFTLPFDIELLNASGHMHLLGKRLVAGSGGHQFLEMTSSQEPVAKSFTPPLELASGKTVDWACTFDNGSGRIVTYGQAPTGNEMCAFVGVFYPRTGVAADLVGP